jgi:hypothetical protein
MGGSNSGRWHGYTPRPLVEETPRLDLALPELKSALKSPLPATRSAVWSLDGTPVSGAHLHLGGELTPGRRLLTVQDALEPELVGEIELERVEQGFAERWYGTCPPCGRPVRTVYFVNNCWQCRTCSGLQYRSVREHDRRVDALIRALRVGNEQAIELALDASKGGYGRIARFRLFDKVTKRLMARAGIT